MVMTNIIKRKPPHPAIHSAVKFMVDEIHRQGRLERDVATRAGLAGNIITNWKLRSSPNINNLEAVLNVLGFTITVTPLVKYHGQ